MASMGMSAGKITQRWDQTEYRLKEWKEEDNFPGERNTWMHNKYIGKRDTAILKTKKEQKKTEGFVADWSSWEAACDAVLTALVQIHHPEPVRDVWTLN